MAEGTRGLELIGLAISLTSLILATSTFCHFRNLWNNRIRIHKNIFLALGIQVILRFIVYLDQFVSLPSGTSSSPKNGKNNSGYVYESFYLLLEYAKTSMYLWMFVDGLYLHNVINVAIASERLSQTFYYCVGWVCPIFLIVFWALAASEEFQKAACSWEMSPSSYFFILDIPRCSIIALNCILILDIVRVLATKMRDTNSPEIQLVRKALRTSVLLLPLLGITNYLRVIYTPTIHTVTWSYLNAFLTSFQGFFCALSCCFLNREVQQSIKLRLRHWRSTEDANNSSDLVLDGIIQQKLQPKCSSGSNGEDVKSNETVGDPFRENWSEVELSSHNNVDIEHIEIPTEFFVKHNRNSTSTTSTCASNKWSHSSSVPSVRSTASSGIVVPDRRPTILDGHELNHVNIN